MEEIWVDIHGFEGFYQVSNIGRVRSLDRTITRSDGRTKHIEGKIISLNCTTNSGYFTVDLYKDNVSHKYYAHRLVAEHFCDNPCNKPIVNHKDENKLNNNADNLCWATYSENLMWNDSRAKRPYNPSVKNQAALKKLWEKNKRPVNQYDICGNYVRTYSCAKEAAEAVGLKSPCSIRSVCIGRRKTAGDYIWKYKIS